MFKPFFAKPPKGPKQVAVLDPGGENSLLYAFVDGVCSSVGAPCPSRIEVNCEVNASVVLRGIDDGTLRQ